MNCARIKKKKDGKLVLEFDVVMRIPIRFEAIRQAVISDVYMTVREKQIFDALINGMSNKEISQHVHVAERTVKFHISSLLAKFHVNGRHELAALVLSRETLKEKS